MFVLIYIVYWRVYYFVVYTFQILYSPTSTMLAQISGITQGLYLVFYISLNGKK